MRLLLLLVFGSFALVLGWCTGDMAAGWGTVPCVAVAAPDMGRAEWLAGNDPDQVHLFQDGRQRGTWRYDLGRYFPYNGSSWGTATSPPVSPPERPRASVATTASTEENFGIDRERWAQEPRRTQAGRGLPEERDKWRLTVIGPEAERRAVLADLDTDPTLRPWRDRLLVQGYPPDHWAVARSGFHTSGQPTIYLQNSEGRVLHRQDDYSGGPKRLAEAVRRADPHYDPRKDPDLTRPKTGVEVYAMPPWAWLALGAIGLWLGGVVLRRARQLPGKILDWLAEAVAQRRSPN